MAGPLPDPNDLLPAYCRARATALDSLNAEALDVVSERIDRTLDRLLDDPEYLDRARRRVASLTPTR